MWTGALVLMLAAFACAITRDQFYPYGHGLDQRLPRGAEVSSPEVLLKVPIVFYGETYENIFVNNFGVLSFRADIPTFLNTEFPLPYPSIAAFYSNIDTTDVGEVYYRETNESHVLVKAEESVQNFFLDYYDFRPTSVFIATWLDVTYSKTQWQDRKNSFQIAVISNGTESFVELLYPEREIQWIQKETQPGSLPDAKAQAGFIAEDGRLFTLRGSGSHQIRNVVSWSNTHEPGKYVYRVGNIPPDGSVAVPDQYDQNQVEVEEETKTCAQSGPSVCHLQARCVDYQAGICCHCNEGFYGNGKSCIKNDVPLRIHGKLNGVINNISLNDIDIQAYVVVADGRTYTALTQAPVSLGSSLQLLNVLGGVMGWLFAQPSGTSKNGYQLTGGIFNHTADIYFPDTKDRVFINQEYIGHDVFDQITLEADIRGTIPNVYPVTNLDMSEYDEEFTIEEPGLIRSVSSRTFINKISGQKYEQRVSQTFSYNPCKYAPTSEDDSKPLTLKVVKNYLGYETKDNIVRFSISNKITSNSQEDPCIEGRNSCGPHSTCVVQGDSFTCLCQSGFTSIIYDGLTTCVDVDECAAATHNCDTNADCFNHDGGFLCRCREGYEGNGESCNSVSRCRNKVCDPNAECIDNPAEEAICICKPGYTGDGQRCWQAVDIICSRCSPNAQCRYLEQSASYSCQCNPGYVGNGEYCMEDTTVTEVSEVTEITEVYVTSSSTTIPSISDYNETYVLSNCEIIDDEYRCFCPPGYSIYKDDLCRYDGYEPKDISKVDENSETSISCSEDSDCPPNAVCFVSTDQNLGHCVCPEGYEGDAYECIERTGSSCSCGGSAHCIDTAAGEMMCVCDPGYHGDGYVCRPNFSCTNNSDCEYNAECRPDPNTYELVCQCIEGYIKDQSDACIPDGQLCNGAVCAEHASCHYDETLEVNYCRCDEGFEGEGISKCVLLGKTCDVANDCSTNAICTQTEASYQCICREGFFGDGYVCNAELNCRTNIYLCDVHASCLQTREGYECECNTGYKGNGSHCELNVRHSGNFLAASVGASVYRAPIRPFKETVKDFATPINTAAYQIAVGIDVDCLAGKIYWGDVGTSAIKRVTYDGSEFEQFLSYDVQSPEGIAVDWAARNMFWTDSKKLTIEVANLDTKIRKVLFKKDGIFNPRDIVVHPGKGKIFWTDWNRAGPKIEWAYMDGSQRGILVGKPDVKLPNSLAIDWSRDRICYTDAGLFIIRCVNINTLESQVIAENCSYPFGLAIYRDNLYWSDWKTFKIEYINLLTHKKGQIPIATATRPYGIAIAPEECAAQNNACQFRNGQCDPDQICLPDGEGGRICAAGDNIY